MNAETLRRWQEARVLFEYSDDQDCWTGPLQHATSDWQAHLASNDRWYFHMRPYRAPGHIQPHDGSPDRPEHVAEDARVAACLFNYWNPVVFARQVPWHMVDYYIVLPQINAGNGKGE